MSYKIVKPIIDFTVRQLCTQPYYNHPKGCPNFNKKIGCPTQTPLFNDVINIFKPVYAIWNVFDFKTHCLEMKTKHPNWNKRQIECCLYWQPKARKQLKDEISKFLKLYPNLVICKNPEGAGVNITETMKNIGHNLEWPPKTKTYQVVLAGIKK